MRILYAGVSDSQWFWVWNGPALANTCRIAFLPLYVLPAIVNVAFGGVRRDRDLRQPLADLDRLADPLDHVLRRSDPDDVAGDHLVVRRRGELLHDPRGIEAVAGGVERVDRRHRVLGQRRCVALEEAAHVPLRLAAREVAVLVGVAGVDPDGV